VLPSVVIVDDHPVFRRAARELLEARGHHVLGEADCGAAAHALVARLAPQAVVLDVELGHECGFDVAWALTYTHPRLAVLLVSAGDAPDPGRVRECGACGFVPKAELVHVDLAGLFFADGD
jgi:two-component system response regulator EvgA